MQTTTTIGLDIAKSVFQVHGVDAAGQVVIRRQLKRRYVLPFFQKLPQFSEAVTRANMRFVPTRTPEQPGDIRDGGAGRRLRRRR
jgi:transposase